jgi:tetratricopeptide (TPR) repeat protein
VAIAKSRIGDGGGLRAAATSVEQALGRSDPDRAIFIAAIELAIHLGDIGRADRALQIAERIEQMAPRLSPGTPFLDARLAALRATVARHVGHPDSALVALGRSIELFEEARDARRACEQRARLGATFAELGAHDRAEAVLGFTSREVDRHRIVGVVPATRLAMAAALSLRRAHHEARAQAEAALAAAREQKDRAVEASAGAALSLILKDLGDAASAESAARAALEVAPAPPERAHALGALASSLVARHLYREAAEASREGVEILEAAAGHVAAESVVRLAHAVATAATGKRAAALDQLKLARERLLSRAAALTDPDDRRRFLEGVPDNARTLELARASLGE